MIKYVILLLPFFLALSKTHLPQPDLLNPEMGS